MNKISIICNQPISYKTYSLTTLFLTLPNSKNFKAT